MPQQNIPIGLYAQLFSEYVPTVPEPPPPPSSAQFASGFEPNTYYGSRAIRGVDQSTGYDWDQLRAGSLTDLEWIQQSTIYYQPNDSNPLYPIAMVADPAGGSNTVLRLRNAQTDGSLARSQYALWQFTGWGDTGHPNAYDQHYFTTKMYIPSALQNSYSFSQRCEWYMIWESHAWTDEPNRHAIWIEKRSNSDVWYMRMSQERPEGTAVWESTERMYDTSSPSVPDYNFRINFDEWFTWEVFFKYREDTSGRFWSRITDSEGTRVIGDYNGRTRHGTALFDIEPFKMYHHADFINSIGQTNQYYDNWEIRGAIP
jgi:hypothetical protein